MICLKIQSIRNICKMMKHMYKSETVLLGPHLVPLGDIQDSA